MRSKWSAEFALLFIATAALEAAWLTLLNVLLQWLKLSTTVALGLLPFFGAVIVGMLVGRALRNAEQSRYSVSVAGTAIIVGIVAAIYSGAPTTSIGDFLGVALVDPGAWLMGIAVVRGTAQADPASGYESERVFSIGIIGLVGFWIIATLSQVSRNVEFTTAAFMASLTFVSAGLLSLGLGRLRDLNVDTVDRSARQRWIGLVLAIVGVVVLIGIPLSALLGVPISSAIFGALGPLAPVVALVFTAVAIPLFYIFTFLVSLITPANMPTAPLPSLEPLPSGAPTAQLPPPPTGAAPDLTWLMLIILIVGALFLVRVIFLIAGRANVEESSEEALETRTSEPIALPSLRLPRLRRASARQRRGTPQTASEAYLFALDALASGPNAREANETPREHALRLQGAGIGRDVGRLATDYQLDQFAQRRLTATEIRRAIERWRRIVQREKLKP